MANTEADTNARPIANVSAKKRKAVFTEMNQSANGKKLKSNERKNPGLLNQGLPTKENFTKEGLSRIVSLFGSGSWYEVSTSFAGKNHAVNGENQCVVKSNDGLEWNALVENVRKKGEHLLEAAAAEYEKSRGKDSDMRWVMMMARKTGTTADKVAAFTVLLQDNAIANLRSLNALLGFVTSKGGKRHAGMGMDALKELFVTSLLPDRKLKFLMQQPIQAQVDAREDKCQVLLWYWEDCLKQRYEHYIISLEEASKDNLPFLKEKALKTIYELLKSKPEQEQRLLSALVNKLGDPERKTASNAGYYLSCLVTAHPNMKMVVVQEVDIFLFRPHLGLRSKYQAVVFLNQIMLSNRGDGPKLARRLIDIYFSLFKVITTSKPRSPHEEWSNMKNKRKVNKIEEEDAGVVEIDSRLLSALLTGVNRAFPYVAAEEVDTLVEEHTPVLFCLVHSKSFNVGVQALMLLYQLVTKKNAISDRLYRSLYAVLLSPGLSKSSKMEMFLGLVFKAIKSDINSKRMAAFAKRLMQVALQGAPQFACGCLLLLSEVLKSRPTLWHAVSHTEDADDEIEHFEDVKDNDVSRTGMLHADNLADSPQNQPADNEVECGGWLKEGHYNARHRDPSFCNADRACWWELIALKFHAHPSVASMAKTLLSGSSILYDGDPLRDLAVGAFLDRFAEKKPKAHRRSETWHGSLPLAPSKKVSPLPVGSDFLNLTEKEVAPEDVIFYKFYTAKAGRKTKSIKLDKREEDILLTGDDELLGDESDDDEIDALLDEDEGAEMGLDDLSEEDDESEGEWTYHQQSEGNFDASNGERIGSEEDDDFEGLIEANIDEDIKTHSFDEENAKGAGFHERMEHSVNLKSGFNKSARQHSQSKQRKKEKRGKEKKAFEKKGDAKSPFADFDEYSHILKDDTTGAERRFTLSKRKPK